MGFGFNLFGFPLLILASVGLTIYFLATKKKIALKLLGGLWTLAIIVFCLGLFMDKLRKPISLTKQGIIGEYRIDTNFYPGTNAKWQYNRYKFTVTPTDSIYFYVTSKDTIIKTFKEKIVYSSGPPDLWKVQSDTATDHVLKHPPTLYRGHKKFYYVFNSDHYGNMFFRKVHK